MSESDNRDNRMASCDCNSEPSDNGLKANRDVYQHDLGEWRRYDDGVCKILFDWTHKNAQIYTPAFQFLLVYSFECYIVT